MIFSDAISRITIRTIQMHPHQGGNDNTTVNFSLSFIFQTSPQFYLRAPIDISPSSSHSKDEYQGEIVFPFATIRYIPPGSYHTYRKKGGYMWAFPRDLHESRFSAGIIQHPKLLNINVNFLFNNSLIQIRRD